MNYHTLAYIKGLVGIITLVLILFFVNPYQDYILAIGGLLISLIFVIWSLGYACSLRLHRVHILHTTKNIGFVSYIYGFLIMLVVVLSMLVMILYHNRKITLLTVIGSGLLLVIAAIVSSYDDRVEDIY